MAKKEDGRAVSLVGTTRKAAYIIVHILPTNMQHCRREVAPSHLQRKIGHPTM